VRRPRFPGLVPRPRLLALGLGAAALLALGTLAPVFVALAAVVLAAALVLAGVDYRLAPSLGPAEIARVAEPQLIIGAPNRIGLTVRNPTVRPLRVRVRDELTSATAELRAEAVVNATGVWAGALVQAVRLRPSKGAHLVLAAGALGDALGWIERVGGQFVPRDVGKAALRAAMNQTLNGLRSLLGLVRPH